MKSSSSGDSSNHLNTPDPLTNATHRFLGMRQPFCFHIAEKGTQVGKESDCMIDRSKQRDAKPRFLSGQLTLASPKTSEPSSTWGYSVFQRFQPYPRLQTLRAARNKMQKKEKLNKETFAFLSLWLMWLKLLNEDCGRFLSFFIF